MKGYSYNLESIPFTYGDRNWHVTLELDNSVLVYADTGSGVAYIATPGTNKKDNLRWLKNDGWKRNVLEAAYEALERKNMGTSTDVTIEVTEDERKFLRDLNISTPSFRREARFYDQLTAFSLTGPVKELRNLDTDQTLPGSFYVPASLRQKVRKALEPFDKKDVIDIGGTTYEVTDELRSALSNLKEVK